MSSLPTLYKKTSVGKIQKWEIAAVGNKLITTFGQVDGKLQTTEDVIKEGKNVGKANATTPEQQATAEALSKWTKQKKKGYVETAEDAAEGKKDALIKGGVDCMLAHKHTEQGHKIKYPAYAQPKLDGIRCLAVVTDGVCTLWSRTRKQITGVPHVIKAIEALGFKGEYVFDGELYNHDFKYDFEKIVHFVRQETPTEGHEVVQYHIYDLAREGTFEDRIAELEFLIPGVNQCLKRVETVIVETYEELKREYADWMADGYEGGMLRNVKGKYVGKRSYDLQKVKEFDEDEFKIVGVGEGRGKLLGHAGKFVCVTESGNEFEAKLKGSIKLLKQYWDDESTWKGKKLTVRYFGLTNTNSVPRFPVGVAVRDYE